MSPAFALALLISAQSQAGTLPTPPRLIAGTITNEDYPAAARAAREEGVAQMSLQISADGRVTECVVTGTSGSAALDSASCSLAQRRYRFRPATRNGVPVASPYIQRVRWSLPRATPEAPSAADKPDKAEKLAN